MRISDWSSDVCSSDLVTLADSGALTDPLVRRVDACRQLIIGHNARGKIRPAAQDDRPSHSYDTAAFLFSRSAARSEEHTSELKSLMRTSYAVFCLKKKKL